MTTPSPSRRQFVENLALGAVGGAGSLELTQRLSAGPGPAAPSPAAAKLDHARYMRLAIEQGKLAPSAPFGAVIVDAPTGNVLAEGHNHTKDNPTFHGEMDAINNLVAKQTVTDWSPLVLYTTAEPCPMCQSAIEWAGIGMVVFGTSVPFLTKIGWWQIGLRAEDIIRQTPFRRTALLGGVLAEECNPLFQTEATAAYRKRK
jgi:tRNA(Arg) A34 adenosine deaminase TadA